MKTNSLSKSKALKPLSVGQTVQVQNQRDPHANKWDLSGVITEVLPFDSYLIKMDGSGKVTKRNRQFIKAIIPFITPYQPALPNQTFTGDIHRETDQSKFTLTDSNDKITPGPTPDKAGRLSTLPISSSPPQTMSDDQLSQQNRGPNTCSDADIGKDRLKAAANIQKQIAQPSSAKIVDNNNYAAQDKRVRFKPQRYIQQC